MWGRLTARTFRGLPSAIRGQVGTLLASAVGEPDSPRDSSSIRPTETASSVLFRRTFVLKLIIFEVDWGQGTWSYLDAATIVAGIGAASERVQVLGLMFLLVRHVLLVTTTFPYTLNHHFLEAWFLLHLVLLPSSSAGAPALRHVSAVHMIRLTVLSVWFFAGVQKAVSGYYLNGEFFAIEMFLSRGRLGEGLRWLASVVDDGKMQVGSGIRMDRYAGDFECWPIDLPHTVTAILLILSWFILLCELLLPALVVRRTTRVAAASTLVALSVLSTAATGEMSFGFSSVGALLLWLPNQALWTFWLLRGALCVFALSRYYVG